MYAYNRIFGDLKYLKLVYKYSATYPVLLNA